MPACGCHWCFACFKKNNGKKKRNLQRIRGRNFCNSISMFNYQAVWELDKYLSSLTSCWQDDWTKSRSSSCEMTSKEHIVCFLCPPQILPTCWAGGLLCRTVTHFHSCSRSLMASFFRPYFSLKLAASRTRAKCAADPGCGGKKNRTLHSGNILRLQETSVCVGLSVVKQQY